jgi:hypothetical protein
MYVNLIIVSLKCLTILSLHPSILEEDEIIGSSTGCMCLIFIAKIRIL